MTQTIKLRRSAVASTVPTTAQLSLGEVAINTFDGKMFIEKDNGTPSIIEMLNNDNSVIGDLSDVVITGSPAAVTDQVLAFDGTNWVNVAPVGISNVVEDTTPQLGGHLYTDGFFIKTNDVSAAAHTSGIALLAGKNSYAGGGFTAGSVTISPGTGSNGNSTGNINLSMGASFGTSSGGNINLTAGQSAANAGDVTIRGGLGQGVDGGRTTIEGGTTTATGDTGGLLLLQGGPSNISGSTGGDVNILGGKAVAGGTGGNVHISPGQNFGDTAGTVNFHSPEFQIAQASIHFWDDTNTAHTTGNYVALKAPSFAGSTNITFVLPELDGTNGHVLQTDGSGNLSFVAGSSVNNLNDLSDVNAAGSPLVADQVLTYDGTNWVNVSPAGGGIANVVEDTSPQLGADLDLNLFGITSPEHNDNTHAPALTITGGDNVYTNGYRRAATVDIKGGDGVNNNSGGHVNLTGGYGGGFNGGYINIYAGNANGGGFGIGGLLRMHAGDTVQNAYAGTVTLSAGNNTNVGATGGGGGDMFIGAGNGYYAGDTNIKAGNSKGWHAGDVSLTAGACSGPYNGGSARVAAGSALATGGGGGDVVLIAGGGDVNGGSIQLIPGGFTSGAVGTINLHTGNGEIGQASMRVWNDTNTGHTTGNYVELKAPAFAGSPLANITFVLPELDGANGESLTTDGSGNLSFSAPASTDITVDNYTDTTDYTSGTSTALTLSVTPASENSIAVFFDGVAQHHNGYTLSGAVVTFAAAIYLGTENVEIITSTGGVTNVPGTNTITTAMIQDDAVTDAKLAESYALESLELNTQTSIPYVLVIGDVNTLVSMNNASNHTLTIPTNAAVAFPLGTQILVEQAGTGTTTISGGTGSPPAVTINSAGNFYDTASQYTVISLIKKATNTWLIAGDLV